MIRKVFSFAVLLIIGLSTVQAQSVKKDVKVYRNQYKADFLKEEHSPFYGKEADLKYLQCQIRL